MEILLSVVALAVFGWVVAFLIPRARREREVFALTCSVLAALGALVCVWLFAHRVRRNANILKSRQKRKAA